jgi:hypothetical protein
MERDWGIVAPIALAVFTTPPADTCPGGVVVPRRPGGEVWFVDLAVAQSDSALADEVASVIGLHAAPGKSLEDRLIVPARGRIGDLRLRPA